jgi:hypothetical protein
MVRDLLYTEFVAGSNPVMSTVAEGNMVRRLVVIQVQAGSNPVGHPIYAVSSNGKAAASYADDLGSTPSTATIVHGQAAVGYRAS